MLPPRRKTHFSTAPLVGRRHAVRRAGGARANTVRPYKPVGNGLDRSASKPRVVAGFHARNPYKTVGKRTSQPPRSWGGGTPDGVPEGRGRMQFAPTNTNRIVQPTMQPASCASPVQARGTKERLRRRGFSARV